MATSLPCTLLSENQSLEKRVTSLENNLETLRAEKRVHESRVAKLESSLGDLESKFNSLMKSSKDTVDDELEPKRTKTAGAGGRRASIPFTLDEFSLPLNGLEAEVFKGPKTNTKLWEIIRDTNFQDTRRTSIDLRDVWRMAEKHVKKGKPCHVVKSEDHDRVLQVSKALELWCNEEEDVLDQDLEDFKETHEEEQVAIRSYASKKFREIEEALETRKPGCAVNSAVRVSGLDKSSLLSQRQIFGNGIASEISSKVKERAITRESEGYWKGEENRYSGGRFLGRDALCKEKK